jgi:hypothetical protein
MKMKVNFVKKNADKVNKIIAEILWAVFAVILKSHSNK